GLEDPGGEGCEGAEEARAENEEPYPGDRSAGEKAEGKGAEDVDREGAEWELALAARRDRTVDAEAGDGAGAAKERKPDPRADAHRIRALRTSRVTVNMSAIPPTSVTAK